MMLPVARPCPFMKMEPARNAFRWIVVALVAASMLIVAAIALNRLALNVQNAQPAVIDVQVPASNMLLPLDATGAGLQIIPEAMLSVRLSPYPVQVNAPSTLTLVALDPQTSAVKVVTPTLEIAPLIEVEGATYAMKSDAAGSQSAGGVFFPEPGEYRLRIRIDLGADEPYSILIAVEAR
jgi:hypothetical protein